MQPITVLTEGDLSRSGIIGAAGAVDPMDAMPFRKHFLDLLLDSVIDQAVIAIDLGGVVTVWNAGARAILGWTSEEIVGLPASLLFTPADREKGVPLAEMQAALLGQPGIDGRWHQKKDGARFWASGSLMPLLGGTGAIEGFVKILRDETAQHLAHRALQADAAFLRRVLAASGDCIKILDLDARSILMDECGKGVAEASDFNALPDCPWTDLWDDGCQEARSAVEAARAGGTGQFQGMADSLKHWDVQVTPILGTDGLPSMLLSVSRDITALKRAEEALRTSEDFLKRTGEVAGVGGWEIDYASGDITWSEQTCSLHDVEPDHKPLLDDAIDYYAPEARPIVRHAIEQAIQFGKAWDLELPLVSAKGRSFWARSVGSVEFEQGEPVRLVGAFQDVTCRKLLERELADSRELLQVTLESIGDAVITTDTGGKVEWMNRVAERLTGWTRDEARGQHLAQVFVVVSEETGAPASDPTAACLGQGMAADPDGPAILVSRDGTSYGVEESAAPIRGAGGQVHGAVLVFHDVSEQRRLDRELTYRATHDGLTGLANREAFEAQLGSLMDRSKTKDRSSALLYIDLDQFKLVNDACGHSVGDQLLRQLSALLKACVREGDTVARLGGDEFSIILEHCGADRARWIAQNICDQMEEFRFVHDGRRFRVGTSIGLVTIDKDWPSVAEVMQAADISCYAAKEAGRNRVHVWSEADHSMKARHAEMQWIARLEQALEEDRFELYGQRIEALDGPTDGLHCEVLLRLRDASGAIVLPGAFMPAAERFHMATRIDRWVVRRTFDWMQQAGGLVDRIGMIAVNLSGQSINDRTFHHDVCEMIRHAAFDVRKLCFEITETAAITNLGEARMFIEEVRGLGVRIALDDFGAGASSFGYLKVLPVDYLKIDGQFITHLVEDALDNAAVRCFRDIARVVGVRTIAEFVECPSQRQALIEIGVDMGQGYLIHRPEPLALAMAWTAAS